jgi:hypothetical protein
MSEKFYENTVPSIQILLEKFVLCLTRPVQLVRNPRNVHTHLSGCPGSLGRHLVDVRIIIIIVELWFARRQGPFL